MKKIFWKIITILFWVFVAGTLVWKGITFIDEDFFEDLFRSKEDTHYTYRPYIGPVWNNDSIDIYYSDNMYRIDHVGECVLDSVEDIRIDFEDDGMSPIWYRLDSLRGYISPTTGQVIIPAQYDKAWFFREGKAAVVKEGRLVFINEQGDVILDDGWEDSGWVDHVFRNNRCVVCKDDKLGLIDGDGHYIVYPHYIDIVTKETGYFTMNDNFFVSRYDWDGHLVQSMCFYSIEPALDKDGYPLDCFTYHTSPHHVGLMDAYGNIVCPPCYRRICGISNHLFLGYRDDDAYDHMQFGELISVY